jgi:Flp pilus assembly protein TadG
MVMKQGIERDPRNGLALIEFSLITPLLLLALAGVLNYSVALRTASCLTDAARIGAWYGSQSLTNASNAAAMQAAALAAAPGIAGMTAAATKSCKCANGSAVPCTGGCSSGNMLVYVQVTTQATSPTLFNYSGLSFSGLISAQVSARAQ